MIRLLHDDIAVDFYEAQGRDFNTTSAWTSMRAGGRVVENEIAGSSFLDIESQCDPDTDYLLWFANFRTRAAIKKGSRTRCHLRAVTFCEHNLLGQRQH